MTGAPTIIVVGRTDTTRESDAIRHILLRLEADGHRLHWFVSDYTASYARITDTIARKWPALATWGKDDSAPRRLARVLIRLMLIAGSANRYDHVYTGLRGQAINNARQLRGLLDTMAQGQVDVVTHSAGGVSATRIADHPRIGRIACFGYPFQHPGHRPQAFRTEHLHKLRKPLLILQGKDDVYGGDPAAFGRHLPLGAQVVSLQCDHDCDRLPPAEAERAWLAIARFLKLPGH